MSDLRDENLVEGRTVFLAAVLSPRTRVTLVSDVTFRAIVIAPRVEAKLVLTP